MSVAPAKNSTFLEGIAAKVARGPSSIDLRDALRRIAEEQAEETHTGVRRKKSSLEIARDAWALGVGPSGGSAETAAAPDASVTPPPSKGPVPLDREAEMADLHAKLAASTNDRERWDLSAKISELGKADGGPVYQGTLSREDEVAAINAELAQSGISNRRRWDLACRLRTLV